MEAQGRAASRKAEDDNDEDVYDVRTGERLGRDVTSLQEQSVLTPSPLSPVHAYITGLWAQEEEV